MNPQSQDILTPIILNALNGIDSLRKEADNTFCIREFECIFDKFIIKNINEKEIKNINIISKSEYTTKWLELNHQDKMQIKNHVFI